MLIGRRIPASLSGSVILALSSASELGPSVCALSLSLSLSLFPANPRYTLRERGALPRYLADSGDSYSEASLNDQRFGFIGRYELSSLAEKRKRSLTSRCKRHIIWKLTASCTGPRALSLRGYLLGCS